MGGGNLSCLWIQVLVLNSSCISLMDLVKLIYVGIIVFGLRGIRARVHLEESPDSYPAVLLVGIEQG